MSAVRDSRTSDVTIVKGACPHDCPDTCALEIHVRDGVALKVTGSASHAPTAGVLCTKVARYTERTYHPNRLLHPLRRIGRKGQGRFERISWDEAIASIANRLAPIAAQDPERILPYSYAGTMGLVQGESMAQRFFHKLGASLLDRTICASAGSAGHKITLGSKIGMDVELADHLERALLGPCASCEAPRRHTRGHRSLPVADRREMPYSRRAAAGNRRRSGLRPHARAHQGRPR
jgi:anaerobic selenocysteine-containing dehydrogenase